MNSDKRTCVILNGPPGVGKDTIAQLLVREHGFVQCENKTPLHQLGAILHGSDPAEWVELYNGRDFKEAKNEDLGGMSPRELYIWLSEEVIKPKFGKNWFGRMSARNARLTGRDVVFSDGGFQPEYEALQDAFGVENVLLVHLFRPGFSFDGDSRNYLKPAGSPYLALELHEGAPDHARQSIMVAVSVMDGRRA